MGPWGKIQVTPPHSPGPPPPLPGQGVNYNVGKFPYMANSRAKTNGEPPTHTTCTQQLVVHNTSCLVCCVSVYLPPPPS